MSELPHFDAAGSSQMVDVGKKPMTKRVAVASGVVVMQPATVELIRNSKIQKGNVLEVARVAGVMATKRTSDLIPLCHPLRVDSVNIEFEFLAEPAVRIEATVTATDRTGVEMEAMTAVAVAGLVIYDMCKSVDRGMVVEQIQLEEKSGGKSGQFKRKPNAT